MMLAGWRVGEAGFKVPPPLWATAPASVSLTISELADQTLEIETDAALLSVTVSAPAGFAGQWTIAPGDLLLGPLNLVPPAIEGTVGDGETLTARPGLWLYDAAAGEPAMSYQWQQDGAAVGGATAATFVVPPGGAGSQFAVTETATDGFGARTAHSDDGAAGATTLTAEDGVIGVVSLAPHASVTVAAGNTDFSVEAA